jgi:hypothetical protein
MSISRTLIVLVVWLTPTAAMAQTTPPAAQPPAKPAEAPAAEPDVSSGPASASSPACGTSTSRRATGIA